ncbi:DJ-1/PfpI family protein [Chromobacterium sp. IIBBL 290-4]|nr:DJ-1/PfpI family protein [Chromobacterium sp. IIBBL 290-4]
MQADGAFPELERRAWRAVLVPGGDPGSIIPDGLATAGLNAAHAQGALIASICGGNLVLAAAGLLKDRRATHNYTADYAGPETAAFTEPYWRGVDYRHCDVARDENLITAMPWAYVEWTATVLAALGLMNAADRQAFMRRHGPRLGPERESI